MGSPPKPSIVELPPLEPGAFLYWLFVDEWNGFIRFAGLAASLEWLGADVDREPSNV